MLFEDLSTLMPAANPPSSTVTEQALRTQSSPHKEIEEPDRDAPRHRPAHGNFVQEPAGVQGAEPGRPHRRRGSTGLPAGYSTTPSSTNPTMFAGEPRTVAVAGAAAAGREFHDAWAARAPRAAARGRREPLILRLFPALANYPGCRGLHSPTSAGAPTREVHVRQPRAVRRLLPTPRHLLPKRRSRDPRDRFPCGPPRGQTAAFPALLLRLASERDSSGAPRVTGFLERLRDAVRDARRRAGRGLPMSSILAAGDDLPDRQGAVPLRGRAHVARSRRGPRASSVYCGSISGRHRDGIRGHGRPGPGAPAPRRRSPLGRSKGGSSPAVELEQLEQTVLGRLHVRGIGRSRWVAAGPARAARGVAGVGRRTAALTGSRWPIQRDRRVRPDRLGLRRCASAGEPRPTRGPHGSLRLDPEALRPYLITRRAARRPDPAAGAPTTRSAARWRPRSTSSCWNMSCGRSCRRAGPGLRRVVMAGHDASRTCARTRSTPSGTTASRRSLRSSPARRSRSTRSTPPAVSSTPARHVAVAGLDFARVNPVTGPGVRQGRPAR